MVHGVDPLVEIGGQHFLYYPQNVATNTCSKIYNENMREREERMGETPLGLAPSVIHPLGEGLFKGGTLVGLVSEVRDEG